MFISFIILVTESYRILPAVYNYMRNYLCWNRSRRKTQSENLRRETRDRDISSLSSPREEPGRQEREVTNPVHTENEKSLLLNNLRYEKVDKKRKTRDKRTKRKEMSNDNGWMTIK